MLLVIFVVSSAPITPKQARTAALNFMSRTVPTVTKSSSCQLAYAEAGQQEGDTLFYVFNVGGGFAIVAADDAVTPILGYSPNGHFDPQNIPDNCRAWLQGYADQIAYVRTQESARSVSVEAEWNALLSTEESSPALTPKSGSSVAPLLTTKWGYGLYYNSLCPEDTTNYTGHVWAGSAATAMAQIINYWEYPVHGYGTHSYYHNYSYVYSYGEQSSDFANTTYQYSLMPDSLDGNSSSAEVNAVATLIHDCGVAVNMNYDPNGSIAKDYAVRAAFISHFGFSAQMASKSWDVNVGTDFYPNWEEQEHYQDDEWANMLRAELDEARPVYYASANGYGNGSAFVCDGYDADTLFHFNWGWNGYANGYFVIGHLTSSDYYPGDNLGTPMSGFSFNDHNSAIFVRPGNNISDTLILNVKGRTTATVDGTVHVGDIYAFNDSYDLDQHYDESITCRDTLTLTPVTPGAQLFVEANIDYISQLGISHQEAAVYDGTSVSGTPMMNLTWSDEGPVEPVISSSSAITIVYKGKPQRIGFDLNVSEVTCLPIVWGFTCTDKTYSTAEFEWHVYQEEDYPNHLFNYQIEYGLHGFAQGTGTTIPATGTTAAIGGLTAETDYDAYLTYSCSGGGIRTLGPVTFRTEKLMDCIDERVPAGYGAYICEECAFQPSYATGWAQHIYTAEELSAIGLVAGDAIISLSVQYDQNFNADNGRTRNIAIFMGNTSVSDFSNGIGWLPVTSMTYVYTYKPSVFKHILHYSWEKFDFDNAFVWDGSSNVVVAFAANGQVAPNYFESVYLPNSNKTLSYHIGGTPDDNFNPMSFPTSWNTSDQLPLMKFCRNISSCMPPSHLTYSLINRHTVKVDWLPGYQETSWNVEYGPAGFEQGTGTTVAVSGTPTLTVPQLASGNYDFYVQADCGNGDVSDWEYLSVSTADYECIQIGNGTSTNSVLPMGGYTSYGYVYTYTQQLYTAAELSAQGLSAGDHIQSLSFQYNGTPQSKSSITVYLGNTTQANMASGNTWIPVSDMQEVFSGTVDLENDWTTVLFDNLFEWDGTSNVVVAFLNNSGTENGTYQSYTYYNNTSMTLYRTANAAINIENPGNVSDRLSSRNNIQFCKSNVCLLQRVLDVSMTEGDTCEFYGTTISEPGVYRHRWAVSEECDSLVVLQITMRKIIFVTTTGAGSHDGTSWANAMELQEAMNAAASYTDRTPYLYVKKGTYTGNTSSPNSYEIKANVRAYGGFNGNEPTTYDLNNRTQANMDQTILFGSNARRVLYQSADFTETRATVFDGFTIRGGTVNTAGEGGAAYIRKFCTLQNCKITANNAAISGSGSEVTRSGVAVYNNGGTLSNCEIYNNTVNLSGSGSDHEVFGVGVYNNDGVIEECNIHHNTAVYDGAGNNWNVYGGGIYDYQKSVIRNTTVTMNSAAQGGGIFSENYGYNNQETYVTNCIISNNTSRGDGGGIYCKGGNGTAFFTQCLIGNNAAGNSGGGVYIYYTQPMFIACDIVRNSAVTNGGGLYSYYENCTLQNSIVWGNKVGTTNNQMATANSSYYHFTMESSAVQGGYSGAITLEAENTGSGIGYPNFTNPTAEAGVDASNTIGDWTLQTGSVCANMGDNAFVEELGTDLGGNARIQQGRADIGAYESAHGMAFPLHPQAVSNILYVTTTGAGMQDGSSWTNATSNLQYAMDVAMSCNPPAAVWVAGGTYTPGKSLVVQPKVAVYGGFEGNEPYTYDLLQRDFTAHATIIDGDSAYRVLDKSCPFGGDSDSENYPTTILMPISGTTEVTACQGVIYDDGGEFGWYSNYCNGTIILRSPNPNATITLTGTYNMENNYDKLFIYDGVGGALLGQYTGYSGSIYLTSSTGVIVLNFTSDFSTNYDGFALNFSSSNCNITDGSDQDNSLFRIGESLFDGFTFQNGYVSNTNDYAGAYLLANTDLLNCKFSHNHQRGVYAEDCRIDNCEFNNNKGYGLYCEGSTDVSNSLAQFNKYGIYFSSTGTLSGSTIQKNTYEGLRMYNGKAEGCVITENGSGSSYYGVYSNGSNVQIINTSITNNNSGGLYASGGLFVNVNIADNGFANNSYWNQYASGVYAENQARFVNCNIVRNNVTVAPPQTYSYAEALNNSHGGVYNNTTNNEYTNCIIWGNSKNDTIADNISGDGTFSYCAIEGGHDGIANITLEANNDGEEDTASYVRFVNPTATAGITTQDSVDYRLDDGSACINMGNPNTTSLNLPTYDLGGSLRIKQNHIDIGAYEYGDVNLITLNDTICLGESFFYNDYFVYPESPGMFRDTFIYNQAGNDYIAYINLMVNGTYNITVEETICEGDTFYFNGQPRTTTGFYTAYLQSSAGCDSTVTLHLIVNPILHNSFNKTACDSFTWNQTTYYTTGDYAQTFEAVTGCDSIVTMHLTVNHSTASDDYLTLCRSALPYYYHGMLIPTTAPEYDTIPVTLATVHNCDSVVTLHLHIMDVITSEFSETACDSYTWNDITYTTGGDKVQTFTSAAGCDSVVTLHLTLNYSVTEFVEVTANDSYTWNDSVYTQCGNYTQLFTTVHGCDSVVTLHLTLVTNEYLTICENELPYHYTNGLIDTLFEQGTPASSIINYPLSTTSGFDSIVVLHVTVIPTFTPEITVTGALSPCVTSSATLTVNGSYSSYIWSTGETSAALTVTEAGTYWVTATDANGCHGVSEPVQLGLSELITETPSICMVGVENNHNLVVWEELSDPDVVSYQIYRENDQANVFELLAVIPAGGPNAYEDVTADPSVRAWRYKITAADSCGGETPMSAYHKTVHLTINQGIGNSWNLIWTPYEGFEFASYRLYRGTTNNNLQLIQTMPATLTSFTDNNPGSDVLFYQIEVVMAESCVQHTRDVTYTGARSNIAYNGVPVYSDTTVSACESYDWNGQTLTESGTYTGDVISELGYLNTVTLHLTIHHPEHMTFVFERCGSFTPTWADGYSETYTESGVYTHSYEDANGCTETDTLYLTITDPPVVDFGGSIHIQQGETAHIYDHLGGNPNWYYFWNNGMEGPSIDVSPSVTTTYTVVVYTDGTFSCYTTATVTVVVTTGVSDYEVEDLTLYPNPTSGKVVIDRENVLSVEVFDKTGRLLTVQRDVNEIDLGAFADGIYTLRISLPEGVVIRKVIKSE